MPLVPDEAMYLVEMLQDAGPVIAGEVLTWPHLESWQRIVGAELRPWEARMLRRLSSDYLGEAHRAEAHDAPPPWGREPTPEHREKLSQHIKNVLRGN